MKTLGMIAVTAVAYFMAASYFEPPRAHRVDHPNGEPQIECYFDSANRLHGEYRMYFPSGRVQSVTNYFHGTPGNRKLYVDED